MSKLPLRIFVNGLPLPLTPRRRAFLVDFPGTDLLSGRRRGERGG